MWRKVALVAACPLIFLLAGCAGPTTVEQRGDNSLRLAIIGDSVAAGTNSCGKQLRCPDNSWGTGVTTTVNSIGNRGEQALDHPVSRINYAYPGSKMVDVAKQAQQITATKPNAVLVEAGGNDYCASDVATMTDAKAFERATRATLQALSTGVPDARIFVTSVPDPLKLYAGGGQDPKILTYWANHDICRALLGKATDTSATAEAERAAVGAMAVAYNTILARVCAQTPHCIYDGGALYRLTFTPAVLSTVDHFHPTVAGQARIAAQEWAGGAEQLVDR